MGAKRKFGSHAKWTDDEKEIVISHYPSSDWELILSLLPNRTVKQIQGIANRIGVVRNKKPAMSEDERREKKRLGMARLRELKPDAVRASRKVWRERNIDIEKAKARRYAARRFFWIRSMSLRGDNRATAQQLSRLWKKQRGRCALTGRRLDRTAQLDHRMPRARGGGDEIENLQWLCEPANLAKRAMTDDEFIELCLAVVRKTKQLEGEM